MLTLRTIGLAIARSFALRDQIEADSLLQIDAASRARAERDERLEQERLDFLTAQLVRRTSH